MHILVVDDESLARQRLIKLLSDIKGVVAVGEAKNGLEAIEKVQLLDPEVVLLDIRMPKSDGLQAAKEIATLPEPPAIVFCTAYDEYALEAFDTFAAGYLVKPVQLAKLKEVLNKLNKLNKAQRSAIDGHGATGERPKSIRQKISTKTRNGIELIAVETIACFVADQKYVTVYHQEGETLIDETLKDLELEFGPQFIRVHRNALVAVDAILGLEKLATNQYEVKLKSTSYQPIVSRRHLVNVRELLSKL